jgi:hypothetical protein
MVTLLLTKTFVTLMATGATVSAQTGRGRGEDYEVAGQVLTYAGGRRRSITSIGEAGTYRFVLLLVSRSDVDLLRAWQGQLVQVRDNRGRRFFGVYYKVALTEIISRATYHVAIELNIVTADEGV